MNRRSEAISKVLTMNDTGETGGHQAGICIPKKGDILTFFPDLGTEEKNPRVALYFTDESGKKWKFYFIYYNNKFFDEKGTRNEYRLTGMTAFFREHGLKAGDTVFLRHLPDGNDTIGYIRSEEPVVKIEETPEGKVRKKLVLNANWKVISY